MLKLPYLVLTISTIYVNKAISIQVLETTIDESVPSPIVGAILKNPVERKVKDLTICIRFNYKILGGSDAMTSRLMTIADWQTDDTDPAFKFFWLSIGVPLTWFGFGHPIEKDSYGSWLVKDIERNSFTLWTPNRWTHICFAYDSKAVTSRMIINGKLTNVGGHNPALENVDIPSDFLMNNRTFIGRCNWDFKDTCSGHYGKLTDFNVWDKALSKEDMIRWTTCGSDSKGNLINWDTSEWYISNMTSVTYDNEDICKPVKPGYVIMPELRNVTASLGVCRKLKGTQVVVKSQKIQDELTEMFSKHEICQGMGYGGSYWGGWWDDPIEGTFTDINNDEPLKKTDFQPWFPGEPNGDRKENCQVVWPLRNAWNDWPCSNLICTFCEFDRTPRLQIRGLCFGTKFDTYYSWTGDMVNGHYKYYGFAQSQLSWNNSTDEWQLKMYKSDAPYAICNDTKDYPLGNHQWTIYGEPCYEMQTVTLKMNLNACDENEFNCDDGTCIPLQGRCDGRVECPDKTDEISCDMIQIDKSYLKEVPAPPLKEDGNLTRVNISLDVLEVLEISEVDSFITLQVRLYLTWYDARLTFRNLKDNENLNTLTSRGMETIWIPKVIFYNTETKMSSLNDDEAFAVIEKLGDFSASTLSDIQNSHIFKGEENPVTISRVYSAKFICVYKMAKFPFDSQVCQIIVTMKGNTGNFARLNKDQFNYLGPVDLTQYFIKHTQFSDFGLKKSNITGVTVKILLGRRILSQILTTYLPTILICIICFSTNYFKPFFFEAIVTVNLTALLVLTTMYISVSNNLPKTAYIKFIDIWLLFNLCVPFGEVLLHTWMDSLREEENRSVNHHGQELKAEDLLNLNSSLNAQKGTKVNPVLDEILLNNLVKEFGEDNSSKIHQNEKQNGSSQSRMVRDINLIAKDEQQEVKARKLHNSKLQFSRKLMNIIQTFASKGLPLIFLTFIIAYFVIGMSFYNEDIQDLE